MTANAKIGYGVTLTWNLQVVAELTKVGGVKLSASKRDATTHDSTNSYKEAIPGLLEAGDVSIEGVLYPGDTNGQVALLTDYNSRTSRAFTITFPTAFATTWTGTAYITGFETGDVTLEDVVPFTATMMITGKPTLGITASDNLSALTITTATLVPAFSATKYSYTGNTTGTSVTVTPTCVGATTIDVLADGVLVSTLSSGGTSSAIAITTAANVTITVKVKTTGKMDKIYTIYLFKSA